MEGIITVEETHSRYTHMRASTVDQVNQYAKNFSEIADMVDLQTDDNEVPLMYVFASAIRQKAQEHLVKQKFKHGLQHQMDLAAEKRGQISLPNRNKDKLQSLFQRASNEDATTIQGKADEFIQRMKYYEKFKQREMAEDDSNDPALKYFRKCQEAHDLLLPIFEKIYRKTLCLQDYMLSDGQCQGLAEACQFIDHRRLNRALFNNCGLSGSKFATILEGLAQIKDFKSIIYKRNEINALSIERLEPLFTKNIPHQLAELQIIDCKIHCVQIEQLLDLMIERCQIRNFALVKVHHSESSFEKLCEYVRTSFRLRDLNVSWQSLRPAVFVQLLEVVKENRLLQSLNISWNKILEDQATTLTEEQIEEGYEQVPLSERNREILSCFSTFIKYNTYLVHLDLRNVGLSVAGIKYVTSFLNKAQALQVMHLGGNDGVTPEIVNWVCERIKGRMKGPEVNVPPLSKEFQYR